MATTPPQLDSADDVIEYITDNDLAYYDHLDEEELRQETICRDKEDDADRRFRAKGDQKLYSLDKTGIARCQDCGGLYGIVVPNWH